MLKVYIDLLFVEGHIIKSFEIDNINIYNIFTIYMINSGTSDKGVSMYVRYYPYNSIFQKEYIEDRIKFYIEDGR